MNLHRYIHTYMFLFIYASCRTYKKWNVAHINTSCKTSPWVMSHISMSHVNRACRERVRYRPHLIGACLTLFLKLVCVCIFVWWIWPFTQEFLYVCIYVYICVIMYMIIHVFVCIYMHVCIYVRINLCTYLYFLLNRFLMLYWRQVQCIYVYTYIFFVYVHVYVSMYTWVYEYINVYIYILISIHIVVCVCVFVCTYMCVFMYVWMYTHHEPYLLLCGIYSYLCICAY